MLVQTAHHLKDECKQPGMIAISWLNIIVGIVIMSNYVIAVVSWSFLTFMLERYIVVDRGRIWKSQLPACSSCSDNYNNAHTLIIDLIFDMG